MSDNRSSWRVSRFEAVDSALLGALLVLGLLGFRSTYGGTRYLVVGIFGVALGLLVAYVSERLKAHALAVAAVTVLVYLLFGTAVALRGVVSGGAAPTVSNLQTLAEGAISGWHDLLTVLPPVGASGNVLAIPYLLGLSGAVLGSTLARRSRIAFLPVLPTVVVLALSILFGSTKPAALVLQGAVFAALALTWTVLRARAREHLLVRSSLRRRLSAAALVATAATGAVALGPVMPFAGANERVVLREYIDPPLDLRQFVSPLTTYRKYVVPEAKSQGRGGLGEKTLFTVDGLPPGSLIRIATMDAYDGTVWGVAGATAPGASKKAEASGSFQRVGVTIPTSAAGTRATVKFTMGELGGIWLPSVGVVTRVQFDGEDADYLTKTFRYNRATDSAVAATLPADDPVMLQPGVQYSMDVVVPPTWVSTPQVDQAGLSAAGPAGFVVPAPARVPDAVKAKMTEVVNDTQGTFARVQALADELVRGAYSNGTQGEIPSLAGHYAARLDRMVSDPQGLVGDAEQYAAVMALMTRQLGIPARVVMGVQPKEETGSRIEVKGTDVTAWVEVGLQGLGWVPVFPTPPSTAKKPQTVPRPKPITRVQEPPKVVAPPRVEAEPLISASDAVPRKTPEKKPTTGGNSADQNRSPDGRGISAVVAAGMGIPVLLLAIVGLIVGLKWRRSRRRRHRGTPHARIAGGWSEVVDLVMDAGVAIPPQATRRDVAVIVDRAPVMVLARRADQAVFAPGEPTESEVADYWADVSTARREMAGELGRWARIRTALNPTSLRR